MGRRWAYKTDDAGKPRRFLSHREALSWAGAKVGKVVGILAALQLLNSAFAAYLDGDAGWPMFALVFAAVWASIWTLASLALYAYVALSGGVMDREALRRYRNNETLPWR